MVRHSDFADTRLLYLLTSEISSVLVRGQLGFMASHGYDVTVACCLDDPGAPRAGAWDPGVSVEHLPLVRDPSPIADIRGLVAAYRLIRRVRPSIVNASTPKAGLLGGLAAWMARVPTRIYVVRGFRFEGTSGWRRRLYRNTERAAIRSATWVVFNSHSLLAVAERERLILPGRGGVIGGGSGNGIDVSRFRELPTRGMARHQLGIDVPSDAVVVGFVGRFTGDKGIADLVGAIDSIRENGTDVRLVLVGNFEDGDPVDADVRRQIEHAPHIAVIPWVDDTAIVYPAIDVLAFPSYREGFPNAPLEAQLCAVPVVGYAATGTVDAVRDGETGLLVTTGDAGALTAALRSVVGDPQRRRQLGSQGPPWVQSRFESEQFWQGWLERYATRSRRAS